MTLLQLVRTCDSTAGPKSLSSTCVAKGCIPQSTSPCGTSLIVYILFRVEGVGVVKGSGETALVVYSSHSLREAHLTAMVA